MSSTLTRNLDEQALRAWPLPAADGSADKDARGQVLIIAGSRSMPGAAILVAMAAMRAGAGKLKIATPAHVAPVVGLGMLEAMVLALPEASPDRLDVDGSLAALESAMKQANAVLIGPGMDENDDTTALVRGLLDLPSEARIVVDAAAMQLLCGRREPLSKRVLVTPHAGEMASMCGMSRNAVMADPARHAAEAAQRWNAVVALKNGPTTFIASAHDSDPATSASAGLGLESERLWRHEGGHPGLAISGSGDTLAGIVVGLAARGASLTQAAAWGVALHARAGALLGSRIGSIGYLAREIVDVVPSLLEGLGGSSKRP